MAKKRLSTVTKVTTAGNDDFIVMNTSDGKTVQIRKSDLLLPNALMNKTPDVYDFDLIFEPGIYSVLNNYDNYPESNGKYGLLRVQGFGKNIIMQELYLNTGQIWLRFYSSNQWLVWRCIIM